MINRVRRNLRRRIEKRAFELSTSRFVSTYPLLNSLFFGYKVNVAVEPESGLIRVHDEDDSILVGRPSRAKVFERGLAARANALSKQYFLDRVPIQNGDLVIDIGANVGELSRAAIRRGARTISIEPEEIEISALRRNLGDADAVIVPFALWKEETELTFYSKNNTGDSSLIETSDYEDKRIVKATTLDAVYAAHANGTRVRFLKLEAEGAEPEILDGATRMLDQVDYISADVGPERGVTADNTLVPVLERLLGFGFAPVAFEHSRGVLLLKNRNAAVTDDTN